MGHFHHLDNCEYSHMSNLKSLAHYYGRQVKQILIEKKTENYNVRKNRLRDAKQ